MLSDWAQEQEPVFIVGPERSGTSLLFQQVSNHPSFCDFKHATVETFCFVKPWLLLAPASSQNYEMRVYLGQKNMVSFQESIKPFIERNMMLTGQGMSVDYINQKNRKNIWIERRYKHVLRAFFYHSSQHLGNKRLVEKTPAHIRCVDEIVEAFPRAKILICTREVTEIIASHKKRLLSEVELGKDEKDPSLAWLSHDVKQYVKYFKSIDNAIKKIQQSGCRHLIVPYSQLTCSAESTMSGIYKFLSEENIMKTSDVKSRKGQGWDLLLNNPPQKNEINISKYLKPDEIIFVESQKKFFGDFWR